MLYMLPTSNASFRVIESVSENEEKSFLFRCIVIDDQTTLPISPISILLLLTVILYITCCGVCTSSPSTALTSHILVESSADAAKLKEEIKNNARTFGKMAKLHSKCPSGKAENGSLGWINEGDMVPPFDKAVFDPRNGLNEVIGPLRTQFGWHLIWIHERVIQK
mmetsp:Transcript_19704/g.28639  ORF Transcript_19704/g.28639 Transcript_19704/m.28639 type:complete len:165 (+) Transcript_19704:136-630(+)